MIRKTFKLLLSIFLVLGLSGFFYYLKKPSIHSLNHNEETFQVKKQSFSIDVKTMGELEAAQSTNIASLIKGDNAKIIYLIADGINVAGGDVLVRLDPTPFEEKVGALKTKIKEQESYSASLKKGLDWEISQAERDDKTAIFEIEAAELELSKTLYGDGPLEIARLRGAMQKALAKYEEFSGYSNDLEELQKEGFLNPAEVKNAMKKLEDEREAYEAAKIQYETYLNHVYPMQVKKAEAGLKQAKMKREESGKIRGHAVGKAMIELEQSYQATEGLKFQLQDASRELALTEIKAPSPGMVVLREDFRNGQRRKPRLGDILVRNQTILDLPDLNFMIVKSKVREVDLSKIEIGKKSTIEIDAYPQLSFNGTISHIGILALPDPGKPTEEKYFEVRIKVDKSDSHVRPGMTTRVVIHGDYLEDALVIPVYAIFHDQKQAYCYVATPKGYEKREVKEGKSSEDLVEILQGLEEGELVCLCPPHETPS